MKHILFIIIISFYVDQLSAQISPVMVCDPTGINCNAYYNLDSAIEAANPQDYVYIPGGSWSISIVINKPLKIIGAGFHPDSTQVTGMTSISGNMIFTNTTEGSLLEGFFLSGIISAASSSDTLKNFIIRRVSLEHTHPAYAIVPVNIWTHMENCKFTQCVVRHGIFSAPTVVGNIIENCILGQVRGLYNSTIRNCVFIYNPYEGTVRSYGLVENSIIKNCIFLSSVGSDNYYTNTGVVFNNNLVLLNNNANVGFSSPVNCIYDIGNCVAHFDSCNLITTYNNNDLFYRLRATSSAKNSGDDGTDIGIFGGNSPWKIGALPTNPHIYFSSIPNSTNSVGQLPLQVRTRIEN